MKVTNEFAEEKDYTQSDKYASTYDVINEATLLKELRLAEKQLKFVGLRRFVVAILGEKGVLEMEQINNESNHQTTVIIISDSEKDETN